MRAVLLVAYLAALFFLPLGFRRREALRIRQTEEFLLLLRRVKREVACFSRPLPDICRRADLPALDAAGFFDALAKNDPATAFRLTSPALSLPADAAEALDAFFSGAGSSLKSEELAACEYTVGRLSQILEREKKDGAARVRLRSTLTLTGGLLFLLLVL